MNMYQILVAEDEAIERKVLTKNIQKHLSDRCTVLEAKNGREAVELFQQHRPEVAILDIEMPGVSGLEAARKIRQSGIPCMILFLTAFDKFSYAREAISLRALDYLLKQRGTTEKRDISRCRIPTTRVDTKHEAPTLKRVWGNT